MGLVESAMFPGSLITYTRNSHLPIIEINYKSNGHIKSYPCLMVESKLKESDKLINVIHFHGNGESLLNVYEMAKDVCKKYPIRVICPEYAGYGYREGRENEMSCYEMAEIVFRYVYKKWQVPIIVSGYSIGSGPATYLATKHSELIFMLVLIGGFTSIKAVAYEKFGKLIASGIYERFPNEERLKKFYGEVVFIHGKYDKTIPYHHAESMYNTCPSEYKWLLTLRNGHTFYEWDKYVFKPILYIWNKFCRPKYKSFQKNCKEEKEEISE